MDTYTIAPGRNVERNGKHYFTVTYNAGEVGNQCEHGADLDANVLPLIVASLNQAARRADPATPVNPVRFTRLPVPAWATINAPTDETNPYARVLLAWRIRRHTEGCTEDLGTLYETAGWFIGRRMDGTWTGKHAAGRRDARAIILAEILDPRKVKA